MIRAGLRARPRSYAEIFALAAVLLSAFALSVLWLRVIPLLQAPDEQAHFDYVYALARVGHPLPAAGAKIAYSPTTNALSTEVRLLAIIQRAEPAAPDYGSAASMQHLDEAVPQTPRSFYEGPRHRVPALTGLYPFGAYGLLAMIADAAGGSPVHMLFAARAACIAFALAGLLFGYLALRELGVSRTLALPLLLAMGFFPLTSFVSSYVQPDDVALAFTSLTLYAAIRLRRRPADRTSFVLYAAALAGLTATKYQYALAVAVASVPYVVLRLFQARRAASLRAAGLAGLLLPAAAALAITLWYAHGDAPSYLNQGTLTANVGQASLSAWLGTALVSYFDYGHGVSATSYWGQFGWMDTVLRIRPDWLGRAFAGCIEWGTWAAIAGTAVLVVRNLRRIALVARARGAASGLRVALGDSLMNAYLAFAVLMVALYVSSGNVFQAQGRNWLPFLPSAFALGVVYVPKLLPRPARRPASAAVLAFLLAFAAVGSYWSLTEVIVRYYHTSAVAAYPLQFFAHKPWAMRGSIDACTVQHDRLIVAGWSIDPRLHRPTTAVAILVDGRLAGWARYGVRRSDVAVGLGDEAYTFAGYEADLPAPRGRGAHRVTVAAVDPGTMTYEISPQQGSVTTP